ncbi:hypothetical protein [Streptomyces griseoaurantiacus]|uniref:hypothetical protein n=1 Tax=Streptomyces griseoaurantiacus TaxID=68213 RepID=UPI0017858D8A|nr:hypothetical protein GCM10018782_57620 [Streptomyces griseoaurantiacus]
MTGRKTELERQEERLLLTAKVPEQLFLAPPGPLWPDNCHAWRFLSKQQVRPPDLADCAPQGTKVTDLDPRLRWHGHMRTVASPAVNTALRLVAEQLRANRERRLGKPPMVLEGPRGTGKSAVLQAIGVHWERQFERLYARDENRIPVILLSVPAPVRGTVRNWPGAFARFLGQRRDSGDPTESVIIAMRNARTLLVLIDGVEQLRTAAEAEQTFAYLDHINASTGATFIYCGRQAQAIVDPLLRDEEAVLEKGEARRGAHTVMRTGRLGFDDEGVRRFRRVVTLFDRDLRLHEHQSGDLVALSEYLHTRSRGYMTHLSQLVCQGAQKAIREGTERLTVELLEELPYGRTVEL